MKKNMSDQHCDEWFTWC